MSDLSWWQRRASGVSLSVCIFLLCAALPLAAAPPAEEDPAFRDAIGSLELAAGGRTNVTVQRSQVSGFVSAVVLGRGASIPAAGNTPAERAVAFVRDYGALFGFKGVPETRVLDTGAADETGLQRVRMQQTVKGIPVTGTEISIHFRGAGVARVFAKTSTRAAAVDTTTKLTADQAIEKARQVARRYLPGSAASFSRPRLEVLDREVLEDTRTMPPAVVWFVEVRSGGVREYVWVDAQRGTIRLRFSQTPHARNRQIHDANGTSVLPGTLVRSEGGAATGDLDADAAYLHAGQTYDYYMSQHGRDSYDDFGAALISTVDYCGGSCPYANAFWNGVQMVYGGGYSRADDVVAHELTHAVTEHSAGLYYFMQSGALNESYSDIFGEAVDLTNGTGTDTTAARWSMGEDIPGGAIRNMMDPSIFGHPARVGDANFWCIGDDNGGVHINSGVPNHAFALMVDGGTYNGYSVAPIGITKAAKIAYRTLTSYLGQASNFNDAYRGTIAACNDLEGLYGITTSDCAEVQDALDAVEMNEPTPCSFIPNESAEECEVGSPVDTFDEGFEITNSGNWTTEVLSTLNHWNGGAGTPDIYFSFFPKDGQRSLWGLDFDSVGDSVVTMANPIAVQPGMKLQFDHAFDFEAGWDAGFIEYSTDGTNWNDAGTLIDAGTPYSGVIDLGRPGFTGSTRGYTTTQLDLSSLAGSNLRIRFRIYTDEIYGASGWFIDNVRFYRCLPELRGENLTANEKDSGPGTVPMKIKLEYPSTETVFVDWYTGNGTATAGSDYSAASGTLQFNPGEVVKTITLDTLGDTTDESDEYFLVYLTNAANAALRLGGLVNIRDNDQVQLSVSDASVMELNSSTVSVNFTISLDQATSQAVTVDLSTANGTATAPADYTARTLTLTFSPGQTSRLVSVSVPGDLLDELDETFFLNATSATNAAIFDGQGVGTIIDNDTNITVSNAAVVEPDSGTVDAIFTVDLSSVSTVPVSVNINTANVSAAAGLDYTSRSFTLTFNPGQTSRTFAISVLGDTVQEANETFNVNLSSPVSGTITDGQGTCTITDNDHPKISIGDASTTEGNSGTKLLSFTLSLSQSSTQTITVAWATAASSATAGSDFASVSGTVTFSPGQVSRAVGVNLVGDTADEVNETFFVNLSAPVNGTILDGQGTGTIVDDDGPVISIGDASVTERDDGTNNMIFTISLSAASPQTVNVSYFTGNGTATAPADYVAKTATIVAFSPGVTSRTVAVVVNGDTVDEANETFNAFLTNPSGGTIGDGTGIGTIIDQDPPRISVADVSVTETDTTNGTVSVTLSLSSAHSSEVSVTASTANGTAIAGSDYTTRSVAILFAPGQTTRTVSITILPDLVDEPNETFLVNLSAPSNATIADGQAVVTILDND